MSSILRKLAAAALLSIGVAILALVVSDTDSAGNKDFTSYWAAGQLLIHHSNPYSPADVLRLEKAVGFKPNEPLIMRNPPYALLLALPLGLVGVKTGAVLWSLLLIAAIVVSVRTLWAIYGYPPGGLHLFGYTFIPVLACVTMGQASAFIVLGVVMFLRWHRGRPFAAGLALALIAIKPHLLLPFGVALVLWIVSSRAYKVLAGAAVGLMASLAVPLWFDPSLWSHYAPVFRDAQEQFTPTLGAWLRLFLSPQTSWIQFIPAALGCAWAVWYFYSHRREWNWDEHGARLLLVSLLVAPYAWLFDEVIALPAILHGLFRYCAVGRAFVAFMVLNGTAVAMFLFGNIGANSVFYSWTPAAWLIWYWLATRTKAASSPKTVHSVAAAQ